MEKMVLVQTLIRMSLMLLTTLKSGAIRYPYAAFISRLDGIQLESLGRNALLPLHSEN